MAAADATGLRATEFAYPRVLPAGAEALVVLPQGSGGRAPVISMPLGAGRVIFSGVLDAWRYRGDDEDAFDTFWRSQLGREAARAPRRLEVMLHPGAATARDSRPTARRGQGYRHRREWDRSFDSSGQRASD